MTVEIALAIIGIIVAILLAVFNEPIAVLWRKLFSRKPVIPEDNDKQESDPPSANVGFISKSQLVKDAISQGRPVCYCTPEGDVMLLKRYGLSKRFIYMCPHCKRRQKTDVTDHVS